MQKLIGRTRIGTAIDAIAQTKAAHWLSKKLLWLYKGLPELIVYGYAFLYIYTGYNKLRHVQVFIDGNSKIPLVGQYAELIGWGIPSLEILLAVLLALPFVRVKKIALWPSVVLMGIFILYLTTMSIFFPDRLCHCGGVIESMDWTTHLIFNLLWLGAGVFAIRKLSKNELTEARL
ncbi:MauE/DoxX family redox-associated membrane protein [Sphingobacterium chuzhouense]|uniref:Methylamine utilisation protein MauE domain-containing protein n=1 Tax=Sphingobacterium chuzhouense TaxID=1742264 RepID=A0ABR7XU50_9SPHI|nr:MauE/DoxX family redox-associated membrane protein [Sphingobacterium chuzhouense]MBD1422569.1 hypothetical protein [Sphingobacterium chuzhouense]